MPIFKKLRAFQFQAEKIWYFLQGPVVPELLRTLKIKQHEYQSIFCFTSLYYPAVNLHRFVEPAKTILIPTLHKEQGSDFLHTKLVLEKSRVIFANSAWEKAYCDSLGAKNCKLVGIGMTPADIQDTKRRSIIYLGRISTEKNVNSLIDDFIAYKETNPNSDLELILAGKSDQSFEIPPLPYIQYLGFVSEAEKSQLIATCLAVANPSNYESLSLLVLEAVNNEKPMILNENCELFQDYAQRWDGIHTYNSRIQFIELLLKLEKNELKISKETCSAIRELYSWDRIDTIIQDTVTAYS
jgi:glycosyltransferase involved in cell wall biosynthesis